MRFSRGGGGESRGAAYCNIPLISTNQLQTTCLTTSLRVGVGIWFLANWVEEVFLSFLLWNHRKCLGPNFIRSVVTEMQISKTCCMCCR